jgi:hypothetical protein
MATEATTPDDLSAEAVDAFPAAESTKRRTRPRLHFKRWSLATLAFVRDWGALPLCAVIGLAAALTYVRDSGYIMPIYDDSFISLNFAQNLAEHGKLSFDGEHWNTGATSPLHVVLLAAVLKAGAAPIFATIAFGVATHMLLTASTWLFALSIFRTRLTAHIAALAMAFTPLALLDTVNGMETGLFLSLVALSGAAYFFHRTRWGLFVCSVCIALAILTRPDGVFLLPAVLAYHFMTLARRRHLVDYIADAVVICALPITAGLTLAGYSLAVTGELGGTATVKLHFFREFALPLESRVAIGGDQMGLFYGPMWSVLGLAIVGASNRRETLFVALFWVPIIVVYLLLFPGSMYHYFFRYQHPILPFIAVFAAGGAYRLLMSAAMGNLMTKALVAAALIIVIVPVTQQYVHWRVESSKAVVETRNDLVAMAQELDDIILPTETLATHDIGAVGYYGHFKVLDLVGLVDPDAVQYHPRRQTKAQIEKERPDFLLIFPHWDRHYLMIDPWYHPEKYQWIGTYPGGELRKAPYFLYRIVYPQYTVGPAPGEPGALQTAQAAPPPAAAVLTFAPSKISPPDTGDAGLAAGLSVYQPVNGR